MYLTVEYYTFVIASTVHLCTQPFMFIHGYDYVSTFLPPALAMVVVAVAVAAVPRVCRSMWRFRCSFRFVAKSSEANEIHNKRVNDEQGSAAQHTVTAWHGTAR